MGRGGGVFVGTAVGRVVMGGIKEGVVVEVGGRVGVESGGSVGEGIGLAGMCTVGDGVEVDTSSVICGGMLVGRLFLFAFTSTATS